jgi:hypothetical protein
MGTWVLTSRSPSRRKARPNVSGPARRGRRPHPPHSTTRCCWRGSRRCCDGATCAAAADASGSVAGAWTRWHGTRAWGNQPRVLAPRVPGAASARLGPDARVQQGRAAPGRVGLSPRDADAGGRRARVPLRHKLDAAGACRHVVNVWVSATGSVGTGGSKGRTSISRSGRPMSAIRGSATKLIYLATSKPTPSGDATATGADHAPP